MKQILQISKWISLDIFAMFLSFLALYYSYDYYSDERFVQLTVVVGVITLVVIRYSMYRIEIIMED